MTHERRVLVTDGEQRSALALVRSLARAGHAIYVCSAQARPLAGASRYSRADARVADPLEDAERFEHDVRVLMQRWEIDTLIPISEAALLALLPARERLGDVLLPFPDAEAFRRICDKAELLSVAQRVGIAIPHQIALRTVEEGESLDLSAVGYPVVVKPGRSVGEGASGAPDARGMPDARGVPGASGTPDARAQAAPKAAGGEKARRTKLTVRHAADASQLSAALREFGAEAYPLLIQQRIVGPGVGIFLLSWGGRVIASFAHRRIREKPPAGGVSVYRESIAADPELVRRSRALLERFGWCGVAMVEYKVEERTGTPYLMEVNGRFWGSLQLAIDAGVDFPALLLAAAGGEPVTPVHDYRTGIRSRWWWGDVDHLVARLRRSRSALSLPPETPGRWSAVRDFLTIHFGLDREEILRRDDPLPFLRESMQWFHL